MEVFMNSYIFTNCKPVYDKEFRWYIEHYRTLGEAKKNCEEGWTVERYTTTKQWMYWE